VVTAAIKQKGEVLEYASEGLRGDERVGFMAILNTATSLKFVTSDELRGNTELLSAVQNARGDHRVNKHREALRYASEDLRGDKEVVLYIVKKEGTALEFASDELRGDKEVVLVAVNQSFPPPSNSQEVVLAVAEQDHGVLQYASKELRWDKEMVMEAYKSLKWP